jgi:uncharacterized protein YjcR
MGGLPKTRAYERRVEWDKEHAKKLYHKGHSDSQIAGACGVATEAVRWWRRSSGLPGNKWPYPKIENEKIPVQSLSQVAAEARAHGMTYGKYLAAKQGGLLKDD